MLCRKCKLLSHVKHVQVLYTLHSRVHANLLLQGSSQEHCFEGLEFKHVEWLERGTALVCWDVMLLCLSVI